MFVLQRGIAKPSSTHLAFLATYRPSGIEHTSNDLAGPQFGATVIETVTTAPSYSIAKVSIWPQKNVRMSHGRSYIQLFAGYAIHSGSWERPDF